MRNQSPGFLRLRHSDDKQEASASYKFCTVERIQQQMVQYHSVIGAFTAYEGFLIYTSGVDHHVSGPELIVSDAMMFPRLEHQRGEDCWLVANSWNDQ